jgi:FtsP/CotA-like multicopper oxidase with cupredoxin domain
MDRRRFLAYSGGNVLNLYVCTNLGLPQAVAALAGGTLDPRGVAQFVEPMVIPPAMPPDPGTTSHYTIAVRQFTQQVLPRPLPRTTVWGYGSVHSAASFHYPSYTIEAVRGQPTQVTWRNELTQTPGDPAAALLPHLLPVDPTLHWANPGGTTDTRPDFTGKRYIPTRARRYAELLDPARHYTRYWGPVPIVTHVHGMVGVDDWADGFAEAWYLPAGADRAGYVADGRWYDYFRRKSGLEWKAGEAIFRYPNAQQPATLWYHDHTIGVTRQNVYAGPAGFYLIRSADPSDNPGGMLPGPAPAVSSGAFDRGIYEIPIVIQDRAFNSDGSLFYPDSRAYFDEFAGPYSPASAVPPIWNPEFFGNTMVANGRTWPFLEVEPRRYRFRILNGCNSRFLILKLDTPDVTLWQIATEGGYLAAPVRVQELLLGPAERVDVVVDFSRARRGARITLLNLGPDAPFGGGEFERADPQTTGRILQFRVVVPLQDSDRSTPPQNLVMPARSPLTTAQGNVRKRALALIEVMARPPLPAIPIEARLGVFDPGKPLLPHHAARAGDTPNPRPLDWDDPVTENPMVGDVEIWEFYNFTADAHPMHVHEAMFEIVDRQPLDQATGRPIGKRRRPERSEGGRKDTVTAYPGEVTRVRMQFTKAGQYVWHCHILEHEDNEMMRQFRIGPLDPAAPDAKLRRHEGRDRR